MQKTCGQRPIKDISAEELTDSFIRLELWDPYFWDKVSHVLTETTVSPKEVHSHFTYYMKASEVLGELGGGKGYVYILTSDFQEGICKIGSTERTPQDRVKEINSATGVILPWKLYDAFACKSPRVVEKLIHRHLSEIRIDPRKEGFAIYPENAKQIIVDVLSTNPEFELTDGDKRSKRNTFTNGRKVQKEP